MTDPLLSIVIPVYNAGKFLPDLLGRLLAAELGELEILLVDDGSGDDSLQICRRYEAEDSRVRVLSQRNSGPSAARNYGLRESRGAYIAFFDADDVIDTDALQKTVSWLPQYDAEIWISDFSRIAGNGCTLDEIHQIDDTPDPVLDADYMARFLSDREMVWNVWRYIFRRDFLMDCGLRFLEGYHCAEDLEFSVHALSLTKHPAFYHNPYYYYRAHYGNTLTRQYTCKRIEDLAAMLLSAETHLAGRTDPCANLLRDKLTREYIRNLSLLNEIPAEQYAAALTAYSKAAGLLKTASRGSLRLVCAAVRTLGLPAASRIILQMKQVKRAIRRKKIEGFEKKCQSKSQ